EKAGRVRDLRTRDLPAIDHRLRESRIQGGVIAAAPRKLGRFELHCLSDGQWRMDGGSVFGVVPKVMWEKLKTPDARNRILMATNCMLVRTRDANILIEAGMGPKLSEKERDIWAYERDPRLPDALAGVGLKPPDIDLVVPRHLPLQHNGPLGTPCHDR